MLPDPESSAEFRSQILRELLAELRAFDSTVSDVVRRLGRLPRPIIPILIVSLRYAEELRHGTDHLVHALTHWRDEGFSLDQLREALIHIRNLVPDFYMHIDGALLRWCDDAIAEAGLCGKSTAEEAQVRGLIDRYGQARADRTGKRANCVAELSRIFDEVVELARRTLTVTEEALIGQRSRVDALVRRTNRTRWRAVVGAAAFIVGVLLWMW
jgi:hypothetical protein